jgi:hypothetical protein
MCHYPQYILQQLGDKQQQQRHLFSIKQNALLLAYKTVNIGEGME